MSSKAIGRVGVQERVKVWSSSSFMTYRYVDVWVNTSASEIGSDESRVFDDSVGTEVGFMETIGVAEAVVVAAAELFVSVLDILMFSLERRLLDRTFLRKLSLLSFV